MAPGCFAAGRRRQSAREGMGCLQAVLGRRARCERLTGSGKGSGRLERPVRWHTRPAGSRRHGVAADEWAAAAHNPGNWQVSSAAGILGMTAALWQLRPAQPGPAWAQHQPCPRFLPAPSLSCLRCQEVFPVHADDLTLPAS